MQDNQEYRRGIGYAIAAYGMWGLVPIYFKAVDQVSALEVVSHRIIWSVLFLLLLLGIGRRWHDLKQLLGNRKLVSGLALSALVVSSNWLVFIWAVAQERILETSLGYFINPLVSVFMGMLFLQERLRPGQWLAISLAAGAVGYQLVLLGSLPWVALALAFSFGTYGLLRKKIQVDAILGLFVETLLMLPFALGYLLWLQTQGQLQFGHDGTDITALLALAGIVTSLPLLAFTAAARRLSLTLIGLLQYIGPTITFMLAVFYYHEPLDSDRLLTFILIWLALLLFTAEGWRSKRRRRALPAAS
ncbi:EamA family transporter RarD [Marinobacterium jannaschii]|uniref:EamA family transporter RarD n=1 Tax=Marinobacterium jannaschii TaxID=64970 RepID=UPI00048708CA|nr:EamA family transporter RarD [Marinobacterium jannaschii]